MKRLKIFLQQKFKESLGRQVVASSVCVEFDKIIRDFFGDDFKDRTKALHFKNGILTIEVNGSVYAQEIYYKTHLIIEELNKKLGEKIVKRIVFRT